MICTLNEKDMDFQELNERQVCNHFDGIECLTTKRGFCDLLKNIHWVTEDEMDISPRTYNLGDPNHRQEFIEEFRIAAALNILKWFVLNNDSYLFQVSSSIKLHLREIVLKHCLLACTWYLKLKLDGAWPGVDISPLFKDQDTSLDDKKWDEILLFSYNLNESDIPCRFDDLRRIIRWNDCSNMYSLRAVSIRVRIILRAFSTSSKQFYMDGMKNIWVVKAPETSCGRGIKLFYRLEDILDWDRGVGGRTAQKYVETPLLAHHSLSQYLTPEGESFIGDLRPVLENKKSAGLLIKFDLRVWVLITSIQPMKVHVYSNIYGRSCGTSYSTSVKSLSNNYMHLTNYSIQKKRGKTPSSSGEKEKERDPSLPHSHAELPAGSSSATKKLRDICNSFRASSATEDHDASDAERHKATEPELLLCTYLSLSPSSCLFFPSLLLFLSISSCTRSAYRRRPFPLHPHLVDSFKRGDLARESVVGDKEADPRHSRGSEE